MERELGSVISAVLKADDEATIIGFHVVLPSVWQSGLSGKWSWLSLSGKGKGTDRAATVIAVLHSLVYRDRSSLICF